MIRRFALLSGALFLALGSLALPATRRQDGAPDETLLARHMEIVEDGLRSLRQALKDESRAAEALDVLWRLEAAVLACKGETPRRAASVPEAERAAFVRAFRREMSVLLSELLDLERAVLDGDLAKARSIYERVKGMEDPAHERFSDEE